MEEPAVYMPERDEETGKYTEEYPVAAFLSAIRELDGAGTGEIAAQVGCDRRTAYVKLNALEDSGQVSSRKVGQTLFWTVAADSTQQ